MLATQLYPRDYEMLDDLAGLLFAAISVAKYVDKILPSRLGGGDVAGAGVFVLVGLPFEVGLIVQIVMRLKSLFTLTIAAKLAANMKTTLRCKFQPSQENSSQT